MVEYGRVKNFGQNSKKLYEAMKIYGEKELAERGVKGKKFAHQSKEDMEKAINIEYMNE